MRRPDRVCLGQRLEADAVTLVKGPMTDLMLFSVASVAAAEGHGPTVGRLDADAATGAGHPNVGRL